MKQVLPADQVYEVKCSFEDRHKYKEAGFIFGPESRSWKTTNPFLADKVGMSPRLDELLSTPWLLTDEAPLLPYQKEGVDRVTNALMQSDFHYLGDAMGLGKTPQAITIARNVNLEDEGFRIAIICLANSRGVWHRHIFGSRSHQPPTHKWGQELTYAGVDIVYSSDQPLASCGKAHMICSYSLAPKILERAGGFDFIILDECQSLSNQETKQTKAILDFCEKNIKNNGAKVLGLSGTWPKNHPGELWPVLNRIGPKMFRDMSYKEFAYRYCQPWRNPQTGRLIVSGFNRTEELNFNLRNLVMTRREVNEVREDLPEPIFHFVELEATHEIENVLKEEKEIYAQFSATQKKAGGMRLGEYATARRRIAEYKAPLIAEFLREKMRKGLDKACVFCHTVELAKFLGRELSDFNAVRITGDTPAKKRDEIVGTFQTDPSCKVFVGNIQAAGVAITLTASSNLFFAETSWVPGENDQVIGRVRRHGQAEQVHVYFLVIRGSLDETILKKAYWKKDGIAKVLNRKEQE